MFELAMPSLLPLCDGTQTFTGFEASIGNGLWALLRVSVGNDYQYCLRIQSSVSYSLESLSYEKVEFFPFLLCSSFL